MLLESSLLNLSSNAVVLTNRPFAPPSPPPTYVSTVSRRGFNPSICSTLMPDGICATFNLLLPLASVSNLSSNAVVRFLIPLTSVWAALALTTATRPPSPVNPLTFAISKVGTISAFNVVIPLASLSNLFSIFSVRDAICSSSSESALAAIAVFNSAAVLVIAALFSAIAAFASAIAALVSTMFS